MLRGNCEMKGTQTGRVGKAGAMEGGGDKEKSGDIDRAEDGEGKKGE